MSCITVRPAAKTQLAPQTHSAFISLVEPRQDVQSQRGICWSKADGGISGHLGDYVRDEIKHLFDQEEVYFWFFLAQTAINTAMVTALNLNTTAIE